MTPGGGIRESDERWCAGGKRRRGRGADELTVAVIQDDARGKHAGPRRLPGGGPTRRAGEMTRHAMIVDGSAAIRGRCRLHVMLTGIVQHDDGIARVIVRAMQDRAERSDAQR